LESDSYVPRPTPHGNLLHNLLLFGRLLRALGLDINPGRMIDLVQALEFVEIGRKADFFYTARSLLVHDQDDLPLFDQAFDLFRRWPRCEGVNFGELLYMRATGQEEKETNTTPPLIDEEEATPADGLD
jgi:uncharacterized protein with von Willebrand factor type A (vWA) domain